MPQDTTYDQRTTAVTRATNPSDLDVPPGRVPGRARVDNGLPMSLLARMEAALGADFGDVRIYTGSARAEEVGAKAFAQGNELHFAPGEYDPESREGQELIGHELVHVVQQREGRVGGGGAINADVALETEADRRGASAASHHGSSSEAPVARGGSTGGGGGVMQLKLGKSTGTLQVELEGKGVVTLPRGTKVDVSGAEVAIKSGKYSGAVGRLASAETSVAFEREPKPTEHVPVSGRDTVFIGNPIATSVDGQDVKVSILMQTRNIYDRVQWKWSFLNPADGQSPNYSSSEGVEMIDDGNPAWGLADQPLPNDEKQRALAGYRPNFTGFKGNGSPAAIRELRAKIPVALFRKALEKFAPDKTVFTENDVCFSFGIIMFLASGPSCITPSEVEQAYTKSFKDSHMYGYAAMSSSQTAGRVKFSPEVMKVLGMQPSPTMSQEEFWKQPVPDQPPNNLELPFPRDYPHENSTFAPLVPTHFLELDALDQPALGMSTTTKENQMKLQTRIESEATLKIANKQALASTVLQLHLMGMGDKLDRIMAGDGLLEGFQWSLTPTEELVFTDEYMDDAKCTALQAGLGIRKRRSSTASKLNVKTGQGYHVHGPSSDPKPGESYPEDRGGETTDIYRRHEVGFSLNPEATPSQIGAFLSSGMEQLSPWNLGGHEATSGMNHGKEESEHGDPIDFSELAVKMVLMGYRRKFNLKATPKTGQGTINIEISCDHTVGCRPKDVPLEIPNAKGFQKYFETLDDKFQERFNVEMELEHLGAGGASPQSQESTSTEPLSVKERMKRFDTSKTEKTEKTEQRESSSQKAPPKGFSSLRPYQRPDADSEKFNTQSFSVFYAAHNRIIQALQKDLKGDVGDDYLESDRQKLETLRDALKIVEERGSTSEPSTKPSQAPKAKQPVPSTPSAKPRIAPDGNCLYNAVITSGKLSITAELLRAFATQLLIENATLRTKLEKYGGDLNRLIETICTNHAWAGDAGDLVPVVVAHYIKRPIHVYVTAERKKYEIQPTLPGDPVVVFYKNDHYEANPSEEEKGWESWEVAVGVKEPSDEGTKSEKSEPKPEPKTEKTGKTDVKEGESYALNAKRSIGGVDIEAEEMVKVVAIAGQVRVQPARGNGGWIPKSALRL